MPRREGCIISCSPRPFRAAAVDARDDVLDGPGIHRDVGQAVPQLAIEEPLGGAGEVPGDDGVIGQD